MFRVEWISSAVDELANMWLTADEQSRAAITVATHVIEQQLKQAPVSIGESRDRGRRVCFVGPLVVTYEVLDRLRLVTILHVRRIRNY